MMGNNGEGEPQNTTGGRHLLHSTTDLKHFRIQYFQTVNFTEALKENRCRKTDHFNRKLRETMSAFHPLFSLWNMEIVFFIYMQGPQRFNGLRRGLDNISSRVLTDKLRHLEQYEIVERHEHAGGRRVEYHLTPRGLVIARHLHPLLFYLHNSHAMKDLAP